MRKLNTGNSKKKWPEEEKSKNKWPLMLNEDRCIKAFKLFPWLRADTPAIKIDQGPDREDTKEVGRATEKKDRNQEALAILASTQFKASTTQEGGTRNKLMSIPIMTRPTL
jgi:hypothetical protein